MHLSSSLVQLLSATPSAWSVEVLWSPPAEDGGEEHWQRVDRDLSLERRPTEQMVTVYLPALTHKETDAADAFILFDAIVCEEYQQWTSVRHGRCALTFVDSDGEDSVSQTVKGNDAASVSLAESDIHFSYTTAVSHAAVAGDRTPRRKPPPSSDGADEEAKGTLVRLPSAGGDAPVAQRDIGPIVLRVQHATIGADLMQSVITLKLSQEAAEKLFGVSGPRLPAGLRLTGIIGDLAAHNTKQRLAASTSIARRWIMPMIFGLGVYSSLWGVRWIVQRRNRAAAAVKKKS